MSYTDPAGTDVTLDIADRSAGIGGVKGRNLDCRWVCKLKRKYGFGFCEAEISINDSGKVSRYIGLKLGAGITTSEECGWDCGDTSGLVIKWSGNATAGIGITGNAGFSVNGNGSGASSSSGVTTGGLGISGGLGVGYRW